MCMLDVGGGRTFLQCMLAFANLGCKHYLSQVRCDIFCGWIMQSDDGGELADR